ncbi:MAG: VTT domain-containing protein [Candidatus Eremiobacteraeota bacterium]|nr:VTT domain-containing protein [Candidatus Eremiobacteraeota bacterium]
MGAAILIASFVLAALVIRYQPHLEHAIRSIGVLAIPIAIVIFGAVAAAPFSVTDALAVMNGAVFGPIWGSVINAVGLVLAAVLGYWINRHASHLLDLESAIARLPRWAKRFPVGSPAFLLAVRIVPGFGGTVATASAAAFRVPLWVHVWTMCAIAVPICTLLAIFGDRVTIFVHHAETRAGNFYRHHHPHFHFRIHHQRVRVTPGPHTTR